MLRPDASLARIRHALSASAGKPFPHGSRTRGATLVGPPRVDLCVELPTITSPLAPPTQPAYCHPGEARPFPLPARARPRRTRGFVESTSTRLCFDPEHRRLGTKRLESPSPRKSALRRRAGRKKRFKITSLSADDRAYIEHASNRSSPDPYSREQSSQQGCSVAAWFRPRRFISRDASRFSRRR